MTPSTPLPERAADKAAWRAWARDARQQADASTWPWRSQAIVEHLRAWDELARAHHVLAYLPMPYEPDLSGLFRDGGTTWYVTRTWPEPDRPLSVHAYRADALERHRFGFEQPEATAERIDPDRIDLVLVPGLAFDAAGTRLGHGRGYYDRLLAEMRTDAVRVGVATDACLVPRLPRDAHDEGVGFLVTESGLRAVVAAD